MFDKAQLIMFLTINIADYLGALLAVWLTMAFYDGRTLLESEGMLPVL